MKKENINKWYNSGKKIVNLIILIIFLIIISSQSFAVNGESSLALFSSVINHNSVYLLLLVYFLFLKTRVGKKYFNYLNLFLVFIYVLTTFTSMLTLFQSFSLSTVLDFITNFVILVYFSHTMFRDTAYWREYKFGDSPFNEITNEQYFYAVIVLACFSLCVSLISAVEVSGVLLSIFDFIFVGLFGRYIFLYREYLDLKKINVDNKGNFDKLISSIKENVNDLGEKLDDSIDKITDISKDTKDKIDDFVEEKELDKAFDKAKDDITKVSEDDKEKVEDYIEENNINEKVDKVKKDVSDGSKELKGKVENFVDEKKIKLEDSVSENVKSKKKKKNKHKSNNHKNNEKGESK